MIAQRYLPAVCVLIALALIPTIIHSYADSTVNDGLETKSVQTALAGYDSRPSPRNATWGKRRFDSDDWVERIYTSTSAASQDELKLTVVRSFDPKSLYHHPELAVAYGPSYVTSAVKRLARRPDVPVHVLSTAKDDGAQVMYALLYDGRFVEDPILFQLRTSTELLFSGRKAMTLFFVTDESAAQTADIETLPASTLLFAAIDDFVSGGGGPTR